MPSQDRRLTLRLIAEELGISKDTAHTIVSDDLGKWKICSRFVPHKLTDEEKAKRMKLLETSFLCITRIRCFWKTSSRKMRPGAQFDQNGNRWLGVPTSPLPKNVVCKNPRSKHCWSPSSRRKASSIRNLFLQAKLLMPNITRQFWTDCYSESGGFGRTFTWLENGFCSTIMPMHTVWSACANSWLRRW